MIITASGNERIKSLKRLIKDKKERDESGLYVAEGLTMFADLDRTTIESVYVKESKRDEIEKLVVDLPCFVVKDSVFDGIADTKTPSGVIAVVKKSPADLSDAGDTTAVLCGVADAGNVGTIMRTACARGIRTLFFVDTADPYSPKAVRASMGAVQKLNIVSTDYETVFRTLCDYDKLVLDAAGSDVYEYVRAKKIALFIGNEAHGVPDEVKKRCDRVLSIPMEKGSVESLNAAVAAGVAMYLIR